MKCPNCGHEMEEIKLEPYDIPSPIPIGMPRNYKKVFKCIKCGTLHFE